MMLTNIKKPLKNTVKKKKTCTCVSIKIDDHRDGDQQPPVANIECSSHPGFCVLDDSGTCTKRESAIHCAEVSLKSLGQTLLLKKEEEECKNKCDGSGCNSRKLHHYKIDLNNSNETGLAADKQCQTCGSECSPATCNKRSRQYFISWDKIRSKIIIFIVLAFVVWLSVYTALSLTSNL